MQYKLKITFFEGSSFEKEVYDNGIGYAATVIENEDVYEIIRYNLDKNISESLYLFEVSIDDELELAIENIKTTRRIEENKDKREAIRNENYALDAYFDEANRQFYAMFD